MNQFAKFHDWIFKIFAILCFSQVKEQLPENLAYPPSNPPSFVFNGQLFAFTHNRSLIADSPATFHRSLFN